MNTTKIVEAVSATLAAIVAGAMVILPVMAADQEITHPAPISTLPDCSYRQLGRAAANLIDSLPTPPAELPPPEECRGRVCDARASRLAAEEFAERMRFEERLWIQLDSERRACGY